MRKIVLMGGILSCALGAGFFFLQGHSLTSAQAERLGSAYLDPIAPIPEPGSGRAAKAILMTPRTEIGSPDVPRAAAPLPPVAASEQNCALTATATPSDMATVVLTVAAPCHGHERIVLHHDGLEFAEVLDKSGKLTVRVPVLNENVVILARTRSGQRGIAVARVPSLAKYDRFVLQWTGTGDFQFHAPGSDAETDARDYLWSASASRKGAETDATPVAAVIPLGNPAGSAPKVAKVYTIPAGLRTRSGDMGLVVEAEVTADTCGRDIAARSLDLRRNMRPRARDIVLSMPDCSAVGEFLVLSNLTEDPMVSNQ
ncbi:hypothetical protein QO034_01265 [Sedimentitalea sp. JM2-8]|uniref:Uncharacterized protein n=1 Tax=Sedimentitalea xiamensis TaxID=3050037 RepID=A0ABT7F9E7_9RHOB|nr:hypothetical protein [Sedimentitalea xiamensis]MDK3071727.1 hypothetical protein [Sedimentitalea xiamensis]